MQNYYQFIIPRLNGEHIRADFRKHLSLVRKGIAGFIVFGGRLSEVRPHLKRLQEESVLPLIIASDLERGLGQQLKGGTSFPPAMAIARATAGQGQKTSVSGKKLRLLRDSFGALAEEARYAGINTIFAPVLDINTNADNPIIGVRAFGEDSRRVSFFGSEMIRVLQEKGIAACGKHFPGHGNTVVDSHISLPSVGKSLPALMRSELRPFRRAIAEGVAMIMLGHLDVPALDPSGVPVSLSHKSVRFLRNTLKYDGILITDAMNMGGLSGFSEAEACFMALSAGVDIVLHPSDAGRIASYLKEKRCEFDHKRLGDFRQRLARMPEGPRPDFAGNALLSETLTRAAVSLPPAFRLCDGSLLVIVSDERERQGKYFGDALRKSLAGLKCVRYDQTSESIPRIRAIRDQTGQVITAVFSETRAWKGNAGKWLSDSIRALAPLTDLFISFGNPYLLREVPPGKKILAYWNSPSAQRHVAGELLKRYRR